MQRTTRRIDFWRTTLAAVAAVVMLLSAPAGASESAAEAGIGVGSALCSLVYGPTKVVYSAMGVIIGGFAWGLSGGDSDVMKGVMRPAIRGDYVVTPAHLRGEKDLEFIGRDPEYRPATAVIEDPYGADPYEGDVAGAQY